MTESELKKMSPRGQMIVSKYAHQTDIIGRRLSYSNGVKNILGVRSSNTVIRLRVTNNWETDQYIFLCPSAIIHKKATTAAEIAALPAVFGLPSTGIPFQAASTDEDVTGNKLTITSLDANQDLSVIANEIGDSPVQITKLSMKSFTTAGVPENTNYGNAFEHYNVNAWKRTANVPPLQFGDFQSSKDNATEILKIDLLKQNFVAPISSNDILVFKVNAGTRLDITLGVGARDSRPERFYRDIQAGTQLLLEEFPNGGTADCGCNS